MSRVNKNTNSIKPYANLESIKPYANLESIKPYANLESIKPYANFKIKFDFGSYLAGLWKGDGCIALQTKTT